MGGPGISFLPGWIGSRRLRTAGLLWCLSLLAGRPAAAELRTGFGVVHTERGGVRGTVFYQKLLGELPAWEATLPMSPPRDSSFLLSPPRETSRLAVALANPADRPLALVLEWTGSAADRRRRSVELQGSRQAAGHIDEWLSGLPPGEFGVLHIGAVPGSAAGGFGVVGLLEWKNPHAPGVYTSLPPLGEEDFVTGAGYFPHVGAGRFPYLGQTLTIETHLYLFNPGTESWTGTLTLRDTDGNPWVLSGEPASRNVQVPPGAVTSVPIASSGPARVGWVELVPSPGSPPLGGWSLFLYQDESGTQTFSAAVTSLVPAVSLPGTIPVDESRARTGVAAVNPATTSCSLHLELHDRLGRQVGYSSWELGPRSQSARFLDELFTGLPRGFQGTVTLAGNCSTSVSGLRLNQGPGGRPILSAVPVWRDEASGGGDLIVPHVVEAEEFKSALYLAARGDASWSGRAQFHTPAGDPWLLTWPDEAAAELPLAVPAAGLAVLVPGPFLHIGGLIRSTTGETVSGAEVRITGGEGAAVTDSSGAYNLVLPVGAVAGQELVLTVTAPGYREREIPLGLDPDTGPRRVVRDVVLSPSPAPAERRPRITFLQLDVPSETLVVELQPVLLRGTLTVTAQGPGGSIELTTEPLTSGRHRRSVDLARLSPGEYVTLDGAWRVGGLAAAFRAPAEFKVLGEFLHTRYNIPDERNCEGKPEGFCFTQGDCVVTDCALRTDGSGKSQWIAEVEENGSGFSERWSFVALEWYCPAPDFCSHKFRRLGETAGCPACPGGYLEAGRTVAVRPDHPDLRCGDRVWVRGVGVLEVTDTGFLPRYDQLDHFAGVSGCDVPVSLGYRLTIKLGAGSMTGKPLFQARCCRSDEVGQPRK